MKKLLYSLSVVLLIAGMTTMTSCKKPEKQIIGKWKVTSAKSDFGNSDEVKGATWTFKENGTFIGDLIGGTDFECDYSCSKNSLSFSGGDLKKYGMSVELEIDEINNKTMSLSGKIKYSGYDDWDDYGVAQHKAYSESFSVRYELEKKK
ncbi:MAG: hypothetical protein J5606_00940 [Bacteroidales bacterium]|nr:hypothetical protein [Bacteroidales bacterium]